MLKYFILILCFSVSLLNCGASANKGPIVYTPEAFAFHDSLQTTIYDAFVTSIVTNDLNKLMIVDENLEDPYWRAYLRYYKSIYHLKEGDREASKNSVETGLEMLDDKKDKNSEDYALIGLMKSFNVQFADGLKAGILSNQATKSCKTALKIDPNNPRAYFVMGSSDFYTPPKYGGGEKTEEYLTKSISLPNDGPITWSREEAFELLIRFYIREKQMEKARDTYRTAIAQFPESYQINQLAKKLI